MMHRISLLVAACLMLGACAGRAPQPVAPPLPPIDDDLMNLLPEGTELAAWLDINALRRSPLGPLFESVSKDDQLLPTARAELLSLTDEVLIGVSAGVAEAPDQFVVLFKGRFDAVSAAQLIAQSTATENAQPMRGITNRTMAVGSQQALASVSALAARQGSSLRADARFADLKLDGNTLVVRYRKGPTAPELPAMVDIGSLVRTEDIASLDASLALGQTVSLAANAQMETPEAAKKTAKKLNRELRQLSSNMLVMLMGIDFLLEKVAVSAQESELKLSIDLDQNDVVELGKLVERLDKIRQLVEGAGAAQ